MSDSNSRNLSIELAHAVQVGDNNKIVRIANYITEQPYRGRDARLRRSLDHDLVLLNKHPEGEARDNLLESIQDKTEKLVERHRTQNRRRGIWIVSVILVVAVVGIVSIVVIDNHAKIAHGRASESWIKQWTLAVGATFRNDHLSPRGNVMPDWNETVEMKAQDPKTGDRVLVSAFKLVQLEFVRTCTAGSDQTPHPKNGRFVLLEFELVGGVEDAKNVTAFSRDDFVAYDLDGNKFSIGDTSGEDCIPGVVAKDGIKEIAAGSTQRVVLLADVPPSGYIAFTPNPSAWWPWEWAY